MRELLWFAMNGISGLETQRKLKGLRSIMVYQPAKFSNEDTIRKTDWIGILTS